LKTHLIIHPISFSKQFNNSNTSIKMRSSTLSLLSVLLSASSINAQTPNAPVINDNVPGQWVMVNPTSWSGDKAFVGQISASSYSGGGILMTLNLNGGSPTAIQGGPFSYHIHQYAVPSNGSCDATGAHLDPTNRGDSTPCDSTKPETCQVGDLSGKHSVCANLPGCTKNFTDAYLSLTPGNPAYIGDKSFVIHFANKTRLACANFVTSKNFTATASGMSSSTTATTTGGGMGALTTVASTTTTTSSSSTSTAGAHNVHQVGGSAVLGLIAVLGFAGL